MRVRHLRALQAPYVDSKGKAIWEGNYMRPAGISLFSSRVVFERGTWWLYDTNPFYMDQSNRYRKLTADSARNLYVSDDTVVLK